MQPGSVSEREESFDLRQLAGGLWILSLASVVGGLWFVGSIAFAPLASADLAPDSFEEWITGLAISLAFASVGAVVATKRARHPIGWILLVAGFLLSFSFLARGYAHYSVWGGRGSLALGQWAAVAEIVAFVPAFGTLVLILPLLFPDGRLLSPRWRIVAWVAGLGIVLWLVSDVFMPGPMSSFPEVVNPAGIASAASVLVLLSDAVLFVLLPALVGAVAAVIVRYVRSSGVARQQFKWVAIPALLLFAFIPLNDFVFQGADGSLRIVGAVMFVVAFGGLPVGVGMAVLRYRLYDIDRFVSRTATYGLVTLVLVGVYAVTVIALGGLVRALTGQTPSDLVVSGSTLTVAALFNPLRHRIQHFIERRFNRSRYDSGQVLEGFSSRLRHNVSLEQLDDELVTVVGQTLQPATVGVWLSAREV